MTRSKKPSPEALEAQATLRRLLRPGAKVYCILRHRSSSGMYRAISLVRMGRRPKGFGGPGRTDPFYLDRLAAVAFPDAFKVDPRHDGLKASGCGMDMGFHLVYMLGSALYPKGFKVSDRTPQARIGRPVGHAFERDGGYALCHAWL